MLSFSDFNSTGAATGTEYQITITIEDSSGMTNEIYLNFTISAESQ